MNLYYDVGVNLISGLIAGIITSVSAYFYLRAQRLVQARRLWRFYDARSLRVIASTSQTERPGHAATRPGTGVGQLRAIAVLSPSIIRGYGAALTAEMIRLSVDAAPDDLKGDVVLLGGPRTNPHTARAFSHLSPRAFMADAPRAGTADGVDSRVHWAEDDGTVTVFDTADEGSEAYGLIVRSENTVDGLGPGRLWIIAGSSTFGTQAAAEWVALNQSTVRHWKRNFCTVVRATTIGQPIQGILTPTAVRQWTT